MVILYIPPYIYLWKINLMWIGTSIFNLVYVDACLSSMGFSGDCYFMISIVLRHLCKRELNILIELSHDSYDMYHVQLLLKLVIIHVTIGNNPIKHYCISIQMPYLVYFGMNWKLQELALGWLTNFWDIPKLWVVMGLFNWIIPPILQAFLVPIL